MDPPLSPVASASSAPQHPFPAPRNPSHAASATAAAAQSAASPASPAPASASPAAPYASINQATHALSLKVMRISAPTLHSTDRPYHEDQAYADAPSHAAWQALHTHGLSQLESQELRRTDSRPDRLVSAFKASLTASLADDMLSNQRTASTAPLGDGDPAPSTLRDWPFGSMLVLPNSFGTISLGETFRAYLCVRNEARHALRQPHLRIEMQTGDAADAAAGRTPPNRTLLADVVIPAPTGGTADEPVYELHSDEQLETTVQHEIKELGPHVLICTVFYKAPHRQPDGAVVWAESSFRKFYKFAVPASPLSIRTKTHEPRSVSQALHPDHRVRERVLLEVQVQNVCASPLVFEALNLRTEPNWRWESIDRPGLSSSSDGPPPDQAKSLWNGINEPLLPDDVRQYLFRLIPTSETPTRPLPAMPLVPATAIQPAHIPGGPAAAPTPGAGPGPGPGLGPSSDRRSLLGPSARSAVAAHQHPGTAANAHPEAQAASAHAASSSTAIIAEAIGSLDVSWRMSQGEPGRLQTSQLIRRRAVALPVRCLPDAIGNPPTVRESDPELPTIPETDAPATPPAPTPTTSPVGLGAAFVPSPPTAPSQAAVATAAASAASLEGLPPPMVEVDLSLCVSAVELAASAERNQPLSLAYQLWIRDLAAFSTVAASKARTQAALTLSAHGEDSDDSDDDRPLSEIASPRPSSNQLPATSSRRSSAVSILTAPSDAAATAAGPKVVGGSRTLFLAAQYLQHPPPTTRADGQPQQSGEAYAQPSPLSAHHDGDDAPLRSEPSSLLRSLTSPATPSKPLVRRSLQQNLVANLVSSPLLRTGSLSSRRSGAYDEGDGSNTPTSRSSSPVFPPTPPPKERGDPVAAPHVSAVAAVARQGSGTQGAGREAGDASRRYPQPYLDPASGGAGTLPDVDGEDFEHRGSSLLHLAPATIAFADGAAVGEASLEFALEYVPLRSGLVRLGGLRILVLGWRDVVVRRGDDGEERREPTETVELRSPIAVREWSVVAELFAK
ncbi:hypothetical protein ACQY0O_006962 [Thecaphora frezii]